MVLCAFSFFFITWQADYWAKPKLWTDLTGGNPRSFHLHFIAYLFPVASRTGKVKVRRAHTRGRSPCVRIKHTQPNTIKLKLEGNFFSSIVTCYGLRVSKPQRSSPNPGPSTLGGSNVMGRTCRETWRYSGERPASFTSHGAWNMVKFMDLTCYPHRLHLLLTCWIFTTVTHITS